MPQMGPVMWLLIVLLTWSMLLLLTIISKPAYNSGVKLKAESSPMQWKW